MIFAFEGEGRNITSCLLLMDLHISQQQGAGEGGGQFSNLDNLFCYHHWVGLGYGLLASSFIIVCATVLIGISMQCTKGDATTAFKTSQSYALPAWTASMRSWLSRWWLLCGRRRRCSNNDCHRSWFFALNASWLHSYRQTLLRQ